MSNDGPTLVKLPRIQKELAQCQMCGYCIDVCEAHRQTPWESVTARGKIYYLNQLDKAGFGKMDKILGRKVTLSPEFVDAMYKCTGCGNCEEICHAKIELVALWEKIRTWMARYGVAPLPVHKKLEASIAKNGNPYGEPKSKRDAWWPEEVKRVTPPDAVFFAGCTGSYRMQGIPQAAVKVLDRAGVSLNCLGENEVCCTSPLLRTGLDLQTLEAARETVTKADGIGAKDMIMSCSGCYKTVSSNFVEYYGKPGQNVYHITQYVDKLISTRKLALPNEFKAKITYHDPCHLGRHSKVFEEPRNILKKIKGVDFVEMERNRENSRCCGAGGGYKSAFNDFAVNIAAERIRDAEKVAIHKRPKKGLLAGLYELPNYPGEMSQEEVLEFVKNMGYVPLRIQKTVDAKHIFSHVEWHMSGYVVSVEENAFATEEQKKLSKEAKLLFVDTEETREKYAIPTAFAAYVRLFLDQLR